MRYGVSFATPSGACAVSACSSCGVSSELIAPTTSHTAIENELRRLLREPDAPHCPGVHAQPSEKAPGTQSPDKNGFSEPPEASNWPSFEMATQVTAAEWPSLHSMRTHLASCTSQMRMERSSEPEARSERLGWKQQQRTSARADEQAQRLERVDAPHADRAVVRGSREIRAEWGEGDAPHGRGVCLVAYEARSLCDAP
eukprot:CAMPEP_0195653546 /NCGR_PEP_ID=MMETSP0815-20121206/33448_1 /TAXON_ID=97485 /ORGANISM="Prymnesium parvum, Strain Texoma1" /LENGTH=198 /DNA_ID=CAMNT_0040797705 /DNA_START=202 /DNA_END=796 /DNA_ORIENTATION=+